MSGKHPWDRNEGKFDAPSSAVPKPPKPARKKRLQPEPALFTPEPLAGELLAPVAAVPEPVAPPVVTVERAEAGSKPSHAAELLKSFVERVMRLRDARRDINDDIKAVIGEAKAAGFNVEALKVVVTRLEKAEKDWDTLDATVAIYRDVVGTGGKGLDPIVDAVRDAGILAHAASAAEGAAPASKKKPTAKERQLREAIGWIQGTRH